MEKNRTAWSGKAFQKAGLALALMLTAISLSACVVADDRDYRGGWNRHHHWNNDGWNGGGAGWQGNGGDWKRHH